jgi:hypothetical protein
VHVADCCPPDQFVRDVHFEMEDVIIFEVFSAPGSAGASQSAPSVDFLGLSRHSGRWRRHDVLQRCQYQHEEHAAVSSTLARLTKKRKISQHLIICTIMGTYLPSAAISLRAADCLRSVVESPFLFMVL